MGILNFSNWLPCLLLAVCCISSQLSSVSASSKMVIYWGQNSIAAYTNDPAKQEPDLRTYCTDSTYDIIVIGFVYLFPTAPGSVFPGMNFANHCEQPFDDANPFVLDCTKNIAPDIEYCQQRGKKIYLSFGGGVGNYGFSSDAEGVTFATLVWNMFLGGNDPAVPRPFGTSIFDGIDLDIEGGTSVGYTPFIETLRNYFATSSRTYEISAAPQCFYPDRIQTTLSTAWFDHLFIQFYNNHCGTQNYFNSMWNFHVWAQWASQSINKDVKLFIGAPASPKAAASGYVPLATLQQIHNDISAAYPSLYGGLMLWDACTSDDNDYFGTKVAAIVHGNSASSSGNTRVTTGSRTTGVKPLTTGVKPLTTGVMKPSLTTGARSVTTGVTRPVTTGKSNVRTTGRITTSALTSGKLTTGAAVIIPDDTTSTSSNGAPDSKPDTNGSGCNYGEMRCTSPRDRKSVV